MPDNIFAELLRAYANKKSQDRVERQIKEEMEQAKRPLRAYDDQDEEVSWPPTGRDLEKPPVRLRRAEGGRVYNPYTGQLSQYGYGPEHRFFDGDPVAPVGGNGGQSATPPPNPYDPANNPYINAFNSGARGTPDGGGAGTANQSNDPGRNDWGGALSAMGNLAGFAMGPFTSAGVALANAGRGINSASTSLLGAMGMSPFGQASTITPLSHEQSVRDMMGRSLGQTRGSAGLDFTDAINDLSTVGQLGAVLDARENNRTGTPAPGGYSQFSNFSGGDPAQGGGSDYNGPGTGTGTAADFGGFSDFGGGDPEAMAQGGYFKGATGGQEDKVPAQLSHGEYVIDAPTVAALGGGNNEAGAKQLDRLREVIRKLSYGNAKQAKPVSLMDAFSASREG